MSPKTVPTLYTCPGEEHPIPRSVHLSRLASFYPKCRDCQHRNDTGQLPQQTLDRLHSTECRVERTSLFAPEGVRGIYLNELTRNNAGQMAAALASLIWQGSPLDGKRPEQITKVHKNRRGPIVVVGYDQRPSSPDIVTGVTTALRRMGCQVIDTNLTTGPCFSFAVDHLHAVAGIYVTGAGCGPSWSGLDFVGYQARPFSQGGDLDQVERRFVDGFSRPTRIAGTHRPFQAAMPYEAGLWKHFHALRPLRVCCACDLRLIRDTLSRIFEKLPCQLHFVDMPTRCRNVNEPRDPDVERLSQTIRNTNSHLGVLIDDDGCRCSFVNEQGRLVTSANISLMMASLLVNEHPRAQFVVEADADSTLRADLESLGGTVIKCDTTRTAMYDSMRDETSVLGTGANGRYCFRESVPTCDAILALGKVLQALSLSDAPFSEIVP